MESAGVPLAVAVLLAAGQVSAQGQAPLELQATIEMPGVKGRIDHFAADVKGHRLFVAALGNNTVEMLDTATNKHVRSLVGFGEPQGVAYLPEAKLLYVANGSADRVDVLDGESLAMVKRIPSMADADNVRYDPAARVVIVGYGKGALRLLRAKDAEAEGEIPLAGHPESFQLEANGARVFVNVPTAQQVAVVDRAKRAVLATWPVPVRANFPMALDEKGKRLFVGARAPAQLLVYDTASGQIVERLSIGGDTDDLFHDAARARLYVVCGEGRIDVFRQDASQHYVHQSSIKTAPRARTGLFVPEDGKLYVAAPVAGSSPARVLVYQVK
jgi:DNA-binding beta-propeller fold protein YncE